MGTMTAFAAGLFIAGPIAVMLILWLCVRKLRNLRAPANTISPMVEVKQEEIITILDEEAQVS